MVHPTIVTALIGGALIGVSATAMLVLNGRIAGISGILGGLLKPRPGEIGWRLLFIAGLLAGGLALTFVLPSAIGHPVAPLSLVALAGILVGVGTELGNGCTSGHGVCGISRLSKRSIVATMTFMGIGFLTTFVARHVLFGGL